MITDRDQLEFLLVRSTVAIEARHHGEVVHGTGFVVAPGVIVTCAHVIVSQRQGLSQDIRGWMGSDVTPVALHARADECVYTGTGLDLAILRLPDDTNLTGVPYVLFSGTVALGDQLWTFGHPHGEFRAGQSADFSYVGPSRRTRGDGPTMHRLRGTPVHAGFSGSAVINRRTGGVCGMLTTSDYRGSAHLVPASEILARCPEARLLHDSRLRAHDDTWLSHLTDAQVRAAGLRFPGPTLRAYLAAVRDLADVHPYAAMLPDAAPPPLSEVYVHQQAQAEPEQRLPAEVVFDRPGDVLLVGGAGAGKSSLLRSALRSLADQFDRDAGPVVPVQILAADLLTARPLAESIATSITSALALFGAGRAWSPEFFAEPPVPGARWLVLIDGLDELMSPEHRRTVLRRLHAISRETRNQLYRFVIASRPDEQYHRLDAFELLPFTSDQLTDLATRWFTHLDLPDPVTAAADFVARLIDAGMIEPARNPLMSTMLCQIYAAHPVLPFPSGRSRIYRAFVDILRERRFADSPTGIRQQIAAVTRRYGALAEAAGEQLLSRADVLIGRLATERQRGIATPAVDLLLTWTADLLPDGMPATAWRSLLSELLRRSGVLVARGDGFIFLHQTVQEFLAAQHVAADPAESADAYRLLDGPRRRGPAPEWLTVRQSYARFLVDALRPRNDLEPALLAIASAGLEGSRFIVALLGDGAEPSPAVIQTAAGHLSTLALRRTTAGNVRRDAIDLLIRLDRMSAARSLASLCRSRHLDHGTRRWAIGALAALFMPGDGHRGNGYGRHAMTVLASLHDPAWSALLLDLARSRSLDGVERRWAAEALLDEGNAQGADLLVRIARDRSLFDFDRRLAANALSRAGDARGPSLIESLDRERGMSRHRLRRFLTSRGPMRASAEQFTDLMARHRRYHPTAEESLLLRAFDFAQRIHVGQRRPSGAPDIADPLAIAGYLADLGMDTTSLAAALLHDSGYSDRELRDAFGAEIGCLVEWVAGIGAAVRSSASRAERTRRMVKAISKDPRPVIIFLADRLHNMRTHAALPLTAGHRVATESLALFVPLAERLGLGELKRELEDLAFAALHPKRFSEIGRLIEENRPDYEDRVQQIATTVIAGLRSMEVRPSASWLPRSRYATYQRAVARQVDFRDVLQRTSVRILVDTVRQCYIALAVIHARWQPVDGRFIDQIAIPKLNLYQSLYTVVTGPSGTQVEFQILTYAMHRTAEFGLAAHWRYKEHKGATIVGPPAHMDELTWLRQLLDWQREASDPGEFLDALRFDVSSREVYVFTPERDLMSLPAGSTPVDFAYAVHTEVGHRCIGARLNGRLVPLESTLLNGAVVEILTSRSETAGPSMDWLGFVRSYRARTKIRQYFNRERREEAIEAGKEFMVKAMRMQGLPLQRLLTTDALLTIARDLNLRDVAALYAGMGENRISARLVIGRLVAGHGGEEAVWDEVVETAASRGPNGLTRASVAHPTIDVEGVSDVWTRLARCCSPVPGDEISGFIVRTGVVSVHMRTCREFETHLLPRQDEIVETRWRSYAAAACQARVRLSASHHPALVPTIVRTIADQGAQLVGVAISTRRGITTGEVQVRLPSTALPELLRALQEIDHMNLVTRYVGDDLPAVREIDATVRRHSA